MCLLTARWLGARTMPDAPLGAAVLTVSRLEAYLINATQAGAYASAQNGGQPTSPKVRQYPSLTVEPADGNDDEMTTEWSVRPEGPGAVCYRLLARRRPRLGVEFPPWEDKAVYHHAGAHLEHPVDASEGVLLLPAADDTHDMVAIVLVWVLLWHIRGLGADERHGLLHKLLTKWHALK